MKSVISGFMLINILFVQKGHTQSYEVKSYEQFEQFISNTSDTLYVVNFWATWCRPCVQELPNFEQLNQENKNVKVILVSLDGENQWQKSLQPFIRKNRISSTVWVIPDIKPVDWIDRIDNRWQGSIPATLFFNNAKGIKSFEEREFNYEELAGKIDSLQQ